MRSAEGRRPTAFDLVLAGALTLASQVEVWAPHVMPGVGDVTGSRALLSVTTLLMTLPLVVRRTFPLLTLATVMAASCAQSLLTTPTEGLATLVAALVAAYSVSAYAPWPPGPAAWLGAGLLITGAVVVGGGGDQVFVAVLYGAAWLAGLLVARHSAEVVRLAHHNRDLTERLASATALLAAAGREAAQGSARTPDDLATLTARELDVVRAIATGRSNAEIADLLVISEWTVKTHVASVLRKLGLRDRAQVVVAAYESGFVTASAGGTDSPTVQRARNLGRS